MRYLVHFETLEPRLLFSGTLDLGLAQTFDFYGGGAIAAVLVNTTGGSAIDYDVLAAGGLGIDLTADDGDIEMLKAGRIVCSGDGGELNIQAGGDTDMTFHRVVACGDGEANIVAGEYIDADIRRIRTWTVNDGGETDAGVEFTAGGEIHDERGTIRDEYVAAVPDVDPAVPI